MSQSTKLFFSNKKLYIPGKTELALKKLELNNNRQKYLRQKLKEKLHKLEKYRTITEQYMNW